VLTLEELAAIEAIRRVLTLYGQLLDDLRFAEWGELFTDDAIWRVPQTTLRGRADIVAGLRAIEPDRPGQVKHVSFTPVLDFESGSRARVWTDFLTLSLGADDAWLVSGAGRYHDVIVFDGSRWRFQTRDVDVRWPPGSEPLTDLVATPRG
jgi:3-phenylpropionate/cinnamic acid dioxygenase small subunit